MPKAIRWTESELDAHQSRNKAAHNALKASVATKKLQALGRLKSGQMNATEARFEADLHNRLYIGDIVWYRFEALKLILAPQTSITVDFFVMLKNGELQAIDVKGSPKMITDDARAKMKIAAAIFPWPFYWAYQKAKKDGGGFEIVEV